MITSSFYFNTLLPKQCTFLYISLFIYYTNPQSALLLERNSTPRGGHCTMRPPAPCRGLARCPTRPRLRHWASGGGLARAALITPSRRRWLPSHASDRRMSWSMIPGVRLVVKLAYSAWQDCGGGLAAKPPPPPLTLLPGAAPLATPPHGGLPVPERRRQLAPGWGRRHPRTGKTLLRIRRR
jgi:hypothetical protein